MNLECEDTNMYVNEYGELVSSNRAKICCETYNLVVTGFHQNDNTKQIHYLLKLTEL